MALYNQTQIIKNFIVNIRSFYLDSFCNNLQIYLDFCFIFWGWVANKKKRKHLNLLAYHWLINLNVLPKCLIGLKVVEN